jgi:Leucine Rich repeat
MSGEGAGDAASIVTAKPLACSLGRLASLRHLNVKGLGLGDEGPTALAAGVACTSGLLSFKSRRNSIGNQGMEALCPALAKHKGLTALQLDGSSGAHAFGRSSHGFDGGAVPALGPMLSALRGLVSISLCHNPLGDRGVRAILGHLAPLRDLDCVSMCGCGMSVEYKQKLREQLQLCQWTCSEPFGKWDRVF